MLFFEERSVQTNSIEKMAKVKGVVVFFYQVVTF